MKTVIRSSVPQAYNVHPSNLVKCINCGVYQHCSKLNQHLREQLDRQDSSAGFTQCSLNPFCGSCGEQDRSVKDRLLNPAADEREEGWKGEMREVQQQQLGPSKQRYIVNGQVYKKRSEVYSKPFYRNHAFPQEAPLPAPYSDSSPLYAKEAHDSNTNYIEGLCHNCQSIEPEQRQDIFQYSQGKSRLRQRKKIFNQEPSETKWNQTKFEPQVYKRQTKAVVNQRPREMRRKVDPFSAIEKDVQGQKVNREEPKSRIYHYRRDIDRFGPPAPQQKSQMSKSPERKKIFQNKDEFYQKRDFVQGIDALQMKASRYNRYSLLKNRRPLEETDDEDMKQRQYKVLEKPAFSQILNNAAVPYMQSQNKKKREVNGDRVKQLLRTKVGQSNQNFEQHGQQRFYYIARRQTVKEVQVCSDPRCEHYSHQHFVTSPVQHSFCADCKSNLVADSSQDPHLRTHVVHHQDSSLNTFRRQFSQKQKHEIHFQHQSSIRPEEFVTVSIPKSRAVELQLLNNQGATLHGEDSRLKRYEDQRTRLNIPHVQSNIYNIHSQTSSFNNLEEIRSHYYQERSDFSRVSDKLKYVSSCIKDFNQTLWYQDWCRAKGRKGQELFLQDLHEAFHHRVTTRSQWQAYLRTAK